MATYLVSSTEQFGDPFVPYRIKNSKSSSLELSLADKGEFIKNYLTTLIIEAMQWYSLRKKMF